MKSMHSVIGASTDDFFARRAQYEGVLELGCVRALGVAQGRVGILLPVNNQSTIIHLITH